MRFKSAHAISNIYLYELFANIMLEFNKLLDNLSPPPKKVK